eukprot:COSAG06_NODE_3508_length_5257_cov_2.595967_5_plen_220_part_00
MPEAQKAAWNRLSEAETAARIAKMSEAQKAAWNRLSEAEKAQWGQAISDGHKARPHQEKAATAKKLSEARTGLKRTVRHTRRPQTEAHRQAISDGHKARPHQEKAATAKKMSKARSGRTQTAAHKQAISDGKTGTKRSADSKRKQVATLGGWSPAQDAELARLVRKYGSNKRSWTEMEQEFSCTDASGRVAKRSWNALRSRWFGVLRQAGTAEETENSG